MPKFLEDRLRSQAASKGLSEKQTARYVYGAMNNLGAMHGNVETAKGARMSAKHAADQDRSSEKQAMKPRAPHPKRHKNLGKYLHPKGGY